MHAMTAETAMCQAAETAAFYMVSAIQNIDIHLGQGYAASHPALIAAYMSVAAADYAANESAISRLPPV